MGPNTEDVSLLLDYGEEELSESQKAYYARKTLPDIAEKLKDLRKDASVIVPGNTNVVFQDTTAVNGSVVCAPVVQTQVVRSVQGNIQTASNPGVTPMVGIVRTANPTQSAGLMPCTMVNGTSAPLLAIRSSVRPGAQAVTTLSTARAEMVLRPRFTAPQVVTLQPSGQSQRAPVQQVVVQNNGKLATGTTPAYQLLLDPNTGIIMRTVPTSSAQVVHTVPTQNTAVNQILSGQQQPGVKLLQPTTSMMVLVSKSVAMTTNSNSTTTVAAARSHSGTQTVKAIPVVSRRPLVPPKNIQVIDLTDEDDNRTPVEGDPEINPSHSKVPEITQGKTFPSLVVTVNPCLKEKSIPESTIHAERSKLDVQMKNVLVYAPAKFAESLMRQGLLRSSQYCSTHSSQQKVPVAFKLGMYSDASQFPYSGGYVWISDCCPKRLLSVFHGSIFQGAPHPPTTLLKLLYHWACQTNIPNIMQWVKVDNYYIKNFFASMRSVCVAAVHENFGKLGRPLRPVEVGIISLGTTSQDGAQRQVKVEVLGVMDAEQNLIRLRAIDPPSDADRNSKKRFEKILEPLAEWLDMSSIIVTDYTVDKDVLYRLGFSNVIQASSKADRRYTNGNVMDYLRRVVPRMFRNTLPLLSRSLIQQFLDELVWRERWGAVPHLAYANIVKHLAEQTKAETGDTLIVRLNKIAVNPFINWSYSSTLASQQSHATQHPMSNGTLTSTSKTARPQTSIATGQKRRVSPVTYGAAAKVPRLSNTVNMESYYYGFLLGGQAKSVKPLMGFLKCPMCARPLYSNIEVVKHLALHAESTTKLDAIATFSTFQCSYCLRDMKDAAALEAHLEEVHINKKADLICRICQEKFGQLDLLISHMSKLHVQRELPYICSVCGYRTSFHYMLIDHYLQAHSGIDEALCPYCLKSISLRTSNAPDRIYVHLKRHLANPERIKCNYCLLSFLTDDSVVAHESTCHGSVRNSGMQDVKLSGFSGTPIVIPIPTSRPSRMFRAKSKSKNPHYRMEHYGNLRFHGIDAEDTCKECGGHLSTPAHFVGLQSCCICSYSTSCKAAMNDHLNQSHSIKNATYHGREPIILENEYHCVCGGRSKNGDQLARHLVVCGHSSAYMSADSARQNTVQREVVTSWSMDSKDNEETNEDSGKSSMLNVLGLVRKLSSDENSSNPSLETSNKNTADEDATKLAASVDLSTPVPVHSEDSENMEID